jgi:O-antigen ligase
MCGREVHAGFQSKYIHCGISQTVQVSLIPPFKSTKSTLTTLIVVAYVGLFFSIPLSNLTLLILLTYCLIKTSPRDILANLRSQPLPGLILLYFVLLVLGLGYTANIPTGLFALEKKLAMVLVPLLALPLLRQVQIPPDSLFRRIGAVSLASSGILLIIAAYKTLVIGEPQAFYFENFTKPLIHYVYYAMYFAIGTLWLLDSLFDALLAKRYGFLILLALFIYSFGFLFLVASKTGILSFGLGSAFLLFRRVVNKRQLTVYVGALLLSAAVFLYFNETTRSRFTELTENLSILTRDQLGDWQKERITGLNMRLLFWKISIVHTWQDNAVLWGVGTGDTQDYLNALYTDPRYNRHGYVGWDTHNQWVFTFVQLGLIGVAVWAALYLVYLKKAWKSGDLKFLVFLFVTFAFSMSESILESNKGIVFFALFFTVLASIETGGKQVSTTDATS